MATTRAELLLRPISFLTERTTESMTRPALEPAPDRRVAGVPHVKALRRCRSVRWDAAERPSVPLVSEIGRDSMSDAPHGDGWWQASDGRWYPPDHAPAAAQGGNGALAAVNRFLEEHPIWGAAMAAAAMLAARLLLAVFEDRGLLDTAWLVVSSAAIYMLGFCIVFVGAKRMRANRSSAGIKPE